MTDPVLALAGDAKTAGQKYGVAPADILGLLSVEGGTRLDAQGRPVPVAPSDGAGPPSFGQFTYGTGASLHVKYGDPASETDAIARYLVQLGYHTDRTRAFAAYNGGPGNPQYDYAAKVIAAAKNYTGIGGTSSASTSPASTSTPSSSSGGLFGANVRTGAVRALLYTALAGAGVVLAGLGISRAAGAGT